MKRENKPARLKLRAIALAAAVVLSVLAGVVAISGAAAAANTSTVDSEAGLRDAVNSASPGDTIVVDGTISLGSPLSVSTDDVTIRGGTLDFTSSSGYGLYTPSGGDVEGLTLEDLVVIGPQQDQNSNYALKISPGATHVTLDNVTVRDSYKTGIDFNGVKYVEMRGVVVEDTEWGNGLAFADTRHVIAEDVTLRRNAWGGVALYTNDDASFNGTHNVTLRQSSIVENDGPGVYAQDSNNVGADAFDDISVSETTFENNDIQVAEIDGNNDIYTTPQGWLDLREISRNSDNDFDRKVVTLDTSTALGTPRVSAILSTIQQGVDVSEDGDTVYVGPGTYTNPVNITDTNVTILGAGSGDTVLRPDGTIDVGFQYGADRRTVFRAVNSTVDVAGVTWDLGDVASGGLSGPTYGVLFWNTTGGITDSEFEDLRVPDSGSYGYYEIAFHARAPNHEDDRLPVLLRNNTFTDVGRVAVNVHGFVDLDIDDNAFEKTVSDFGYGVELGSEATGVIQGNEFRGFDTDAASDGSQSAGIYVENAFTTDSGHVTKNVTVRDNEVYDSTIGVWFGQTWNGLSGDTDIRAAFEDNHVHDNEIGVALSDENAEQGSSLTVLASGNTVANNTESGYHVFTIQDGPNHLGDGNITLVSDGDEVSGSGTGVLVESGNKSNSSIDVKLVNGDFSRNGVQVNDTLNVTDTEAIIDDNDFDRAVTVEGSGPFEPVIWSSIQDGLDAANDDDDIVHVESGTYDENVTVVDDGVTILGTNEGEAVIRGQVAIEASDVTVDGFGFLGTAGDIPEDSNGFTNTVVVDENNDVISNVTIRNSTLDGQGEVTRAIHLTTIDSGPITIENVTIGDYFLGVNGYGDEVTVKDSSITDIEEGGVNLQQGDDLRVINSNIAVGDAHDGNRYAVRFGYTMTKDGQPRDRNLVIEDSTLAVEIGSPGGSDRHAGVIIRNSSTGDLSVSNSTVAGLISDTGTKVDATHNHWGHASGPAGRGADVVGDVVFKPFWLDEDLESLSGESAEADVDTSDPETDRAEVELDDDTSVEVSLPKGSAKKVSVVEADRSTASTDSGTKNVTDSSGSDKNAIYMDISADTDVTEEVTITVNKSVSLLENRGIDPNTAVLNHFNETSQEWEELDTDREFIHGGDRVTLTATTKGLSPFAITEEEPQPTTGGDTGGGGSSSSRSDDTGTRATSSGSARASVTSVGRQLSVTIEDAQPGDSVTVQRSDEEVTEEVRRHGSALESIEITFDQPADFEMTVTSSNNKPDANVPDPPSDRGTVGYVNVQHSANDDAVGEVRFRSRVTTERLEERGIDQNEVVLYRYSDDGEWTALETTFDGVNDDGTLRFTAVSPGLSVFAIGGPQAQQETPTEAPTTTETTTDETVDEGTPTATETEQIEEPSGFGSGTTFLVVVALALIVIATYALRRRRS